MKKPPNISLGYGCLRKVVCEICAPAPDPDTRSVPQNREAVRVSALFSRAVFHGHTYTHGTPTLFTVYANAELVTDIFWLAVQRDRSNLGHSACARSSLGSTRLNLLPAEPGRPVNQFRDKGTASLVVFVCWQSDDGFTIGRNGDFGHVDDCSDALLFEPGYALVVWGGEAVAILGYSAGRPYALATAEGEPVLDDHVLLEGVARQFHIDPSNRQVRP